MKIPLTKNQYAFVDKEDYEKVSKFSWYFHTSGKSDVTYAARRTLKNEGKKMMLMHRLIMNAKKGEFIDHKNGNGLDNRKKNLRICSKAENMRNRGKTKKNISGYKGVWWENYTHRWYAQLNYLGKHLNLGRYDTKEEAALAYNRAVLKYHGKFAKLNEVTL